MAFTALPLGERIRQQRRREGRTQTVVAGLAGITAEYLSQIERGLKTPSHDVLARIAAELGTSVAALLGESALPAAEPTPSAAAGVVRALLAYTPHRQAPDRSPAELRGRVEDCWRTWQTSPTRFTDIESLLPDLVTDVDAAVRSLRQGGETERRDVQRTASDLYGLLRSYCRRVGRLDLSLMSADRALRAAEDADCPLRIAAAQWNLGHVLLSKQGAEPEAAEVALQASEDLRRMLPPGAAVAALRGALELVAVVADARTRRAWAARERLKNIVAPLARAAGETNTCWTVFGPTNVALHAVSVEMTDGNAVEGLRLADQVGGGHLASRERRFTFGLEVAACYSLRREDAAVLVHLLELDALAPEDMSRSPLARELVATLLRRARPTYRPQVTRLAERLELL